MTWKGNQIGVEGCRRGVGKYFISIGLLRADKPISVDSFCSQFICYYLFWPNMFTELSGIVLDKYPVSKRFQAKSPIFLDLTINIHPPLPMTLRKAEENNSEMSAAKEVSILKDTSLGD